MKTNRRTLTGLFATLAITGRLFAAEPAAPAAPTAPDVSAENVLGIPKDILAKMPPEKVAELAREQARLRKAKSDLEPLLGIVFVFGMPVAIVAIVMYSRHRRNRILHETLRTMIEKGVTIPPELLQPQEPRRVAKSDLRRGLVWIAIGAGVTIYLIADHSRGWAIGLIPLLIGAAFLITWKVEGSKSSSNPS